MCRSDSVFAAGAASMPFCLLEPGALGIGMIHYPNAGATNRLHHRHVELEESASITYSAPTLAFGTPTMVCQWKFSQ